MLALLESHVASAAPTDINHVLLLLLIQLSIIIIVSRALGLLFRYIHQPLVITCAAMDDVTAWCILAFVISIVAPAISPMPSGRRWRRRCISA